MACAPTGFVYVRLCAYPSWIGIHGLCITRVAISNVILFQAKISSCIAWYMGISSHLETESQAVLPWTVSCLFLK